MFQALVVIVVVVYLQIVVSLQSPLHSKLNKNSRSKSLKLMPIEYTTPQEISTIQQSISNGEFIFLPPEVGPEIYAGSIIAVIPFIWASIKFYGRIRIQQECLVCKGSGLVSFTKGGTSLKNPRKCWSCGGILPWLGAHE